MPVLNHRTFSAVYNCKCICTLNVDTKRCENRFYARRLKSMFSSTVVIRNKKGVIRKQSSQSHPATKVTGFKFFKQRKQKLCFVYNLLDFVLYAI